jgi:hypothetical protein
MKRGMRDTSLRERCELCGRFKIYNMGGGLICTNIQCKDGISIEDDLAEVDKLRRNLTLLNRDKQIEIMAKTIHEWLNELPDGYRERALKYCDNPDSIEENLIGALYAAFYWGNTPEGLKFWSKVKDHYGCDTNLPKLPKLKFNSPQ